MEMFWGLHHNIIKCERSRFAVWSLSTFLWHSIRTVILKLWLFTGSSLGLEKQGTLKTRTLTCYSGLSSIHIPAQQIQCWPAMICCAVATSFVPCYHLSFCWNSGHLPGSESSTTWWCTVNFPQLLTRIHQVLSKWYFKCTLYYEKYCDTCL